MTRIRAIAIAAIVTLIVGSTAAGITGNIGGNGGATVAVADVVAPASTTSSQPAQVVQQPISYALDDDEHEADHGGQVSFEMGQHERGYEEDD